MYKHEIEQNHFRIEKLRLIYVNLLFDTIYTTNYVTKSNKKWMKKERLKRKLDEYIFEAYVWMDEVLTGSRDMQDKETASKKPYKFKALITYYLITYTYYLITFTLLSLLY